MGQVTGSGFAIDFMNLDAANPQVIVISTVPKLLLVGATSGAVLYDSSADPAIPTSRDVASGIYFYELDVEGKRMSSKLVQVR